MMRLLCRKLSLFTPAMLILLCCSCGTKQPGTGEEAAEPSSIVAKIGDYTITKEELKKEVMETLRSQDSEETGPVDAKTVLLRMIADKAMIMEARKSKLQESETVRRTISISENKKLIGMLLQNHVQGKIEATEAEIDEKVKANPELSRSNAKAIIEKARANKLINDYYSELYKKFHVQKLRDNFAKASEIHQKLLLNSDDTQRIKFIRANQVINELTPEEKGLVLAKYDNGEVTLTDWFDILFEIAPPSRPKDLHTPGGVERLLDNALNKSIFVSEAKRLGLDKDEELVAQIKEQEDWKLLREMRNEKTKDVKGPTNEKEIIAYFNKHKESFGIEKRVKIDQIWCEDLKTAQKVKSELDKGKDFESAKQEYSSYKGNVFYASPSRELMFFDDLWKCEPNEIAGPIKGFYGEGFKWRLVKILEKKPGQLREYSDKTREYARNRMEGEEKKAVLAKYRNELLEKYPYEIFADRIKDIDPLNIP